MPGGADQQGSLRDLAAQLLELAWILQELDDLLQLVLGLVHPRHVLERDARFVFGQQLGLGLAEAHRAATRAIHRLAHEEEPQSPQQHERQECAEKLHPGRRLGRLGLDIDAVGFEALQDVRRAAGGKHNRIALVLFVLDDDLLAANNRLGDLLGVRLRLQLAVADLSGGLTALAAGRIDHAVEKREQHGHE